MYFDENMMPKKIARELHTTARQVSEVVTKMKSKLRSRMHD